MVQPEQLMIGDAAPSIVATTSQGEPFDLSAHRGGYVVVYFFKRANTPG